MAKLFLLTVPFILNTDFLSGSLEFWCELGKECLPDQGTIKTLSIKSLMNFSSRRFMCFYILLLD